MARPKKLQVEADELRAELETLLNKHAGPKRRSSTSNAGKEKKSSRKAEKADVPEQELGDIERSLKDLAELGEKEIAANPVLSVGLAFLLGLIIGRLSRA